MLAETRVRVLVLSTKLVVTAFAWSMSDAADSLPRK